MKYYLIVLVCACCLLSCNETTKQTEDPLPSINWKARKTTVFADSTFVTGATYLSVYSQIYSLTEHRTHNLTATVSMRNVSPTDTVYIDKADFYDTHGDLVNSYIEFPVYLKPLETLEIVIKESDKSGGTGGNFIFNWHVPKTTHDPLFEAVMISTMGQQGLSFSTEGKRIE
ncbi:DUF3124 domain-containing protein [Mangrovimonas spongiae]|uniref:DUF3124 domain-containing protein n=1 Tax=Mangrovimonas spongiae TaxID=2494697 RepID=A0A3R9MCE9_9FLAO|nr:DUF3124 domain-containing protein [Mangrovimonas spongiae]RSK38712.1 DUF3124 domain-containing protein [Mangrovimonas spongiae]